MKKKITLKDWTYIGRYNPTAKWCRPFCSYTLKQQEDGAFVREQYINLFGYILIFIPVHLAQLFVCVWDGGLKEFTILGRSICSDYIMAGGAAHKRAEEVWNNNVSHEMENQDINKC